VINKYFYSGAVDEVAIWKKALNVDEISDLFNQGNGAAVPDELANLYYKRSDGSEVSLTGGISNFVNHDEIDIEQISFKGLVYHLQELTEIVCSYNPNHKICPNKKTSIRNSILGMTFVRIPAGTFMMGSPEDEPGRQDDEQLHQVTISDDFYLQTTEVTQGQWKIIMGNNPSHFSSCGDNCPVEYVSWNDVQEFIKILNNKGEGAYRLPTEAEWEYAARAGTNTPFSFGECLSDLHANFDYTMQLEGCPQKTSKIGKTMPVASFEANPWGLYDMNGNLWEWCQDWAQNYINHTSNDIIGTTGVDKIIRGGSWNFSAPSCRSADRWGLPPDNKNVFVGFRLVISK
jgi:formylglycine-generating enzyme required for sulfatase activity